MSVDGLNVFTFSELRNTEGKYKGAPPPDAPAAPKREAPVARVAPAREEIPVRESR